MPRVALLHVDNSAHEDHPITNTINVNNLLCMPLYTKKWLDTRVRIHEE